MTRDTQSVSCLRREMLNIKLCNAFKTGSGKKRQTAFHLRKCRSMHLVRSNKAEEQKSRLLRDHKIEGFCCTYPQIPENNVY